MVKTFSGRRKELVAILNGVASGRPTAGEAPAMGSSGGKRVGRPWERAWWLSSPRPSTGMMGLEQKAWWAWESIWERTRGPNLQDVWGTANA